MKKTLILIFFLILSLPVYAESVNSKIRNGLNLYKQQKFDESLKKFLDVQVENPENPELKYNIANSYYKMKNYEEAIKNYISAANSGDKELEQKSYYNIGNCLYRQGKLQESIEYYKKSLELNPDDKDAKFNLEFVRNEIKKRINQEKERQKKQQKNKEQRQKKENKQKIQPQKSKENKNQKQNKKTPQNSSKDKNKPENIQTQKMSEQEAQKWLDKLKENQKDLMRKQVQSILGQGYGSDKDW